MLFRFVMSCTMSCIYIICCGAYGKPAIVPLEAATPSGHVTHRYVHCEVHPTRRRVSFVHKKWMYLSVQG